MRKGSSSINLCSTFDRDNTFTFPSPRYIDKIRVSRTMVNHIRRVERAKSTIDNKIPKSFLSSQIRRNSFPPDLLFRNHYKLSHGTISDLESLSGLSSDFYNLKLNRTDYSLRQKRLSSAFSVVSLPVRAPEKSADVIERFPESFVEGKPFHPRIKKTKAVSKLALEKSYCPGKTSKLRNTYKPPPDVQSEVKPSETTSVLKETTSTFSDSSKKQKISQSTESTIFNVSESIKSDDESYESQNDRAMEDEYTEFLIQVSDEILKKGIFTQKNIEDICERHVEKNKHRLSKKIMNIRLSELRKKLGILDQNSLYQGPESSSESNDLTNGSSNSNYGSKEDKQQLNLEARNRRRSSKYENLDFLSLIN